ncbi:hypothetical protein AVEN_207813-1 [Araneus ventricosus]|uniref:Uncharacterized protein n=1 Tax=Araneus ventricosus TaxID=182803 RepID=A0A4Y2BWU6_ARAVE|nr:hypothetical protein AVEN_207813-1 [Araneus ventricosus]
MRCSPRPPTLPDTAAPPIPSGGHLDDRSVYDPETAFRLCVKMKICCHQDMLRMLKKRGMKQGMPVDGSAIKRERRVAETDEERSRLSIHGTTCLTEEEETEEPSNSRLSDMAQRGQEKEPKKTEEQRNRRLRYGQRSQSREEPKKQ